MVRFIHLSDLHLGVRHAMLQPNTKKFKVGRDSFVNWFNKITLDNFRRAVEYAGEKGIDLILVAGDIFDSADSSLAFSGKLSGVLEEAVDHGISTIFIAGNHDANIRRRLSISLSLFTRRISRDIRYFDVMWTGDLERGIKGEPVILNLSKGDLDVVPLPYIHPAKDWKGKMTVYIEKAAKVSKARYKVLLAHLEVAGIKYSERSRATPPTEAVRLEVVSKSDLRSNLYDYVALGHIHLMQLVSGNAYYSGSLNRIRFDEADDTKYFLDVELDGNRARVNPVEVDCVKMVRVDVSLDRDASQDKVLNEILGKTPNPEDSLVSIKPVILSEAVEKIDYGRWLNKAMEKLFEEGAAGVKILPAERLYVKASKPRVSSLGRRNVEEALKQYIEHEYRGLDEELRRRIYEKALEYLGGGGGYEA